MLEIRKNINDYTLTKENISTDNAFVIAGYSPPWIPRFLARNEVMVKVME
jgi:hypothetical protein